MGLRQARTYEDLLGDALMRLLGQGMNTLEAFVSGLNELNVHGPNGAKWTVELLAVELKRLGA